VNAYIDLLKTPGIARIIAAQLTARLPGGMLSLAILLHVEQIHNSYGAAGLVLAATSIGQGVAGPLTSRWMGIWGMRKVLILTLIVSAAAVFTIALVPLSVGMFMVVGLIAGLSNPPVQPAVRTIYPKMVNSKQLTPLFSLDASAQEIIWVAGPVAATFLAIQISTTTAIVVAGAFLLGGGAWFIASPEVGQVRIPRSKRSFGTVLRRRPVMLATITGFLLVGAAAAVEASVVSVFGHDGPQAGFALGIFAVGSLFGGLFLGHLSIGPWALARRMLIVFVGLALTVVNLEFWWLAVVLLIAGVGIAPAFAVIFAIVSASVKFSDTAEAYGWVGTGQLIGAALGSAVAGFLIDAHGPIGGFWAAAIIAALGVIVPTLLRGWHPDLRGKDASPIPDTEPISTLRQ
jgi:MFS family permease